MTIYLSEQSERYILLSTSYLFRGGEKCAGGF